MKYTIKNINKNINKKKIKQHKYTKNNKSNIINSKSLKINHRHKSLLNRNKNKLKKLSDMYKLYKLENILENTFSFNMKFLKYINDNDNKIKQNVINVFLEVCNNIDTYNPNKKDMIFFINKFGKFRLNYAKDIIQDDFALPKSIDNESDVTYINEVCNNKYYDIKLRMACFDLMKLLIKNKRYEIVESYINKISKVLFDNIYISICINIIKKYKLNTLKNLAEAHINYLII